MWLKELSQQEPHTLRKSTLHVYNKMLWSKLINEGLVCETRAACNLRKNNINVTMYTI